jgi:microcystin-dependent protein
MGIENYNTTPANNGSVLSTGSLVEGQAPSTLNDAMRQTLADMRAFYNDPQWIEYGIGNGSTTYTRVNSTTVTIGANVINAYHVGRRVKIVDGTATTIYGTITSSTFNSPNTTIVMSFDGGASIGSGTITSFKIGAISSTNTSAPTNVASGGIIMWTASSLPDGWLLADGSLVNKTDYATLFGILGNSFGTATSTQFYLPNLTDKFVIGKGSTYSTLGGTGGNSTITPSGSNSAPTFSGSSSSVSGSVSLSGSTASHTLTTSEIPSHSHYLFADHSMEGNNQDWTRVSGNTWSGGDGHSAGKQKSASVEYYQASGSDDFKYRIGYDTNNATPSSHPSSPTGSGSGHSHSLSGSLNLSGGTVTPSGTVSAPTFSGASSNIINPYIALSYIIKT